MADQRVSKTPSNADTDAADVEDERIKSDMAKRLRQAVDLGGGPSKVSEKSGVPLRTLGNYTASRSEIKSTALTRLADACGVSVDWLATGRLPVHPVDRLADLIVPTLHEGVLLNVIEAVETVPESRLLVPRKKAQVIGALYSMWADGQIPSAEKGLETAARLVALASA